MKSTSARKKNKQRRRTGERKTDQINTLTECPPRLVHYYILSSKITMTFGFLSRVADPVAFQSNPGSTFHKKTGSGSDLPEKTGSRFDLQEKKTGIGHDLSEKKTGSGSDLPEKKQNPIKIDILIHDFKLVNKSKKSSILQ